MRWARNSTAGLLFFGFRLNETHPWTLRRDHDRF